MQLILNNFTVLFYGIFPYICIFKLFGTFFLNLYSKTDKIIQYCKNNVTLFFYDNFMVLF